MDGLRHPVGRKPARVYWMRRLLLLAIVVLVVVVAWFLIFAPSGDGTAEESDPAATASVSADATTSAAAADAAADANRACGVDDVEIAVTPADFSVAVGTAPVFKVKVTHVGSSACLFSTGGKDSDLVITSGSEEIYSTADCRKESTIKESDFLLSDGSTEKFNVTWTGNWSAPDCGDSPNETQAGYYWATLTLQGIEAEPTQFEITA
ncbi:hypothetical protein [Demequina salsinemoris]|uniref:hypothetical protein n=1 Tax=Demequina salsinemoris TaxID=577470 RepID=UPI0007813EEE|nr:hypothetical protein [Demequina salsinemoris]